MDKRAKLLSGLCQLGSISSGGSTNSRFADIMDSDLDLSDVKELAEREGQVDRSGENSDFSDDDCTDSDDDLEAHLQLLRPRELENLGVDALRNRQHSAAIKYFNMARLEWAETLAKNLALGAPMQLEKAAVLDDWILAKYMQIATCQGEFSERHELEQQFEALMERAAKFSAASMAVDRNKLTNP